MESSLSSTFCFPLEKDDLNPVSSSSSSSSSPNDALFPFLIPPNAAFPPANEKGECCTAVPNTLTLAGALNVPKSETTLRGDVLVRGGDEGGVAVNFVSDGRGGRYGGVPV